MKKYEYIYCKDYNDVCKYVTKDDKTSYVLGRLLTSINTPIVENVDPTKDLIIPVNVGLEKDLDLTVKFNEEDKQNKFVKLIYKDYNLLVINRSVDNHNYEPHTIVQVIGHVVFLINIDSVIKEANCTVLAFKDGIVHDTTVRFTYIDNILDGCFIPLYCKYGDIEVRYSLRRIGDVDYVSEYSTVTYKGDVVNNCKGIIAALPLYIKDNRFYLDLFGYKTFIYNSSYEQSEKDFLCSYTLSDYSDDEDKKNKILNIVEIHRMCKED